MWKAIPVGFLAIAFITVTILFGLITWHIRYAADDRTLLNLLFVTIFAATPVLTFALLLGRNTWVWRQTCAWIPSFGRKYDLSGKWEGKTRSTFPVGAKAEGAELYEGVMSMEITQSWLTMTVKTTRPDSTTVGRSVVSEIILTGIDPVYHTVFTARNFEPTEGDSASWFGTSRFEFVPERQMIVGNYCSNRGYVSGSATAGDFNLQRVRKTPETR